MGGQLVASRWCDRLARSSLQWVHAIAADKQSHSRYAVQRLLPLTAERRKAYSRDGRPSCDVLEVVPPPPIWDAVVTKIPQPNSGDRMNSHMHARLSANGRALLVSRVVYEC